MRAIRFATACGALVLAAALAGPASAQGVRVVVNDREVFFPDQQPVQRAGRVYIPLRGVLDRIGAETIDWRPDRGQVFVASGGREVLLQIGSNQAWVGSRTVGLDAPPILVHGRTLVPLRFVSENLGATVDWNARSDTAFITAPQSRIAGERETYPRGGTNRGPAPRRDENPLRQPPPGGAEAPPLVRPMRPAPGEVVDVLRPQITVVLRGRSAEIDRNSIRMRVNGNDVTPDLVIRNDTATYRPPFDLESGPVRVHFTVADRDGNVATRDWTFRIR